MNILQPIHPSSFSEFPLRHHDAHQHHSALSHIGSQKMSSINRARKRKAADDDADSGMSISPTNSPPAFAPRSLFRPQKKIKASNISGHSLSTHRLFETLDASSLRTVLQTICERHPDISSEVISLAPRPSVEAAIEVLSGYQERLQAAFPYGGNPGSDYAFNRVKQHLTNLIDAVTEFTPHYLPPSEDQTTISLSFLDFATKVIHDLPEWESNSNQHYKENAYDEITRAWVLVVSEASKRGGGFQIHAGGWDQILTKHNEQSRGRMESAVRALGSHLGWIGGMAIGSEYGSFCNQILNCTPRSAPTPIVVRQY
ncbi:Tethering factor for nuclear proteasome sts1 [Erysiphe necator]|nr:Tethering factor for nuclear proteasome sts1 [Erysiphe necator]